MGSALRWLVAASLGMVLLASAAGAAAPTITEYSAGITAHSAPEGIAAGPDGNLWFTELYGDRVAKITPAGVATEYRRGITADSNPAGIAAGPDGNLWFTEVGSDKVAKITPAGVVTEYRAGITADSGPDGIAAGPDGNLWFTEADGIGKITPAGVVTEYRAGITADSIPAGIAAGPDGNLWFTEADGIGKITPAGVVTEYRAGITAGSSPRGIAAGPDGNLWFTEEDGNRVAKITPAGVVTEYRAGIAAESHPWGIAAGPDGNLWFTELYGDRVAKITPVGVVTEYHAGITDESGPRGIAAGPDGNLWFTEFDGDGVAKITPVGVVTEHGPDVTVTVTLTGKGRVTGGGINCPARCKTTIASGTRLTLRASAARGYRFAGWSGACAGIHACALHPDAAVEITATFRKRHAASIPAPVDAGATGSAVTTKSKIGMLAADGRQVALASAYSTSPPCIGFWEPPARRVQPFDEVACEAIDHSAVDAVGLAGRRLGWVASMETLHYDLTFLTATASRPKPVVVANDLDAAGPTSIRGSGDVLVFMRHRGFGATATSEVWRIVGKGARRIATLRGEAQVADVGQGRIVVRRSGSVAVLSATGRLLRELRVAASAVELEGDVLVAQRAKTLLVYSVATGRRSETLRLQGTKPRLRGLARGVAVYLEGTTVRLLAIANARTGSIPSLRGPVDAQLTPAGLFYSSSAGSHGRVVFEPFTAVVRRLK